MGKIQLKRGIAYEAEIHLKGMEALASNRTIADRLTSVGFVEVEVSNLKGGRRKAFGRWNNETGYYDLPHQVDRDSIYELAE